MRHSAMLALVLFLSSCTTLSRKTAATATGGDPDRGAAMLSRYGCGSCHTIPGIPRAHGLVGPPLAGIASRMYVAGILPNQPVNLMRWVQDPQSFNEKTVMPNLGVTVPDAADIAAYLYSLK